MGREGMLQTCKGCSFVVILWFQIHSYNTVAFVDVQEFNTTYSVEVAACTQAGSGMVSPRVWLFVPADSKLLYRFTSSSSAEVF